MSGPEIGSVAVVLLLLCVYLGMHVAVALILVSFASVALLKNVDLAARLVAAASNDALQEYLFGVVPLFVLMGFLVSTS